MLLQVKQANQDIGKYLPVPGSSEEKWKGEMLALNSQPLSMGFTTAGKKEVLARIPVSPKVMKQVGLSLCYFCLS